MKLLSKPTPTYKMKSVNMKYNNEFPNVHIHSGGGADHDAHASGAGKDHFKGGSGQTSDDRGAEVLSKDKPNIFAHVGGSSSDPTNDGVHGGPITSMKFGDEAGDEPCLQKVVFNVGLWLKFRKDGSFANNRMGPGLVVSHKIKVLVLALVFFFGFTEDVAALKITRRMKPAAPKIAALKVAALKVAALKIARPSLKVSLQQCNLRLINDHYLRWSELERKWNDPEKNKQDVEEGGCSEVKRFVKRRKIMTVTEARLSIEIEPSMTGQSTVTAQKLKNNAPKLFSH